MAEIIEERSADNSPHRGAKQLHGDLEFHKGSLDFYSQNIIQTLHIRSWGAVLLGVGGISEVVGFADKAPVPAILGVGALAMGTLMHKGTEKEIMQSAEALHEEHEKVLEIESTISGLAN